ncbi:LBH domain-containing protein 2-like isoform X1 [Nerophis ophidion]|uniref:LBH domain-containing protein 2-like isoform X1 n=1 Tax=Nerophis ophidion TaxID=159077 RepID=UPI002ADF02E6|nr:LBH domain-containing protein 2-like isoform X1 [Nerophis ophidion]
MSVSRFAALLIRLFYRVVVPSHAPCHMFSPPDVSLQIFPGPHERHPKLSKRLPSIVVEPTDGAEVESGELRWPPEPSSPDAQTAPAVDVQVQAGVGEGVSGVEMPASK